MPLYLSFMQTSLPFLPRLLFVVMTPLVHYAKTLRHMTKISVDRQGAFQSLLRLLSFFSIKFLHFCLMSKFTTLFILLFPVLPPPSPPPLPPPPPPPPTSAFTCLLPPRNDFPGMIEREMRDNPTRTGKVHSH